MKKSKRWGGLNFTADTNCGIDWQSEFDMPGCPGSPNTSMYPGDPTKKTSQPGIVNSDTTPATPQIAVPKPTSKMPSWGWWLLGALAATGIIIAMKKK